MPKEMKKLENAMIKNKESIFNCLHYKSSRRSRKNIKQIFKVRKREDK